MGQLTARLSDFWSRIQETLFPCLEEELDSLTEKQKQLITILELVRIEEFVPNYIGCEGRPLKDRKSLARSFVAKTIYNLNTTLDLIERLQIDKNLRRICGWETRKAIPNESTFSRAFSDFAQIGLPQKAHEALIKNALGDKLIQNNSRDSTPVEAREKAQPKTKKQKEKSATELTRLGRQKTMSLEEMINDLPIVCDKGGKKDSKGNMMYWTGYKLHLDTVDGGIPVSAIISSASLHDSQVAIPLAISTASKIVSLYDLMDSAYDVPAISDHSQSLGHVPLIDKNPRRNKALQESIALEAKARKNLNWAPAEAIRYNARTTAERANARLKDEFGARKVRVQGHAKVACHLMFGVLVLAADQLIRLVS